MYQLQTAPPHLSFFKAAELLLKFAITAGFHQAAGITVLPTP